MNKSKLVETINEQLADLDLPDYRKVVSKSGRNVSWLLKNITKKNNVSEELIEMLKELKR